MAQRGRPTFSKVRQNIVEILNLIGRGYGYQIYTIHREFYQPTTLRLIYYHLKKGVALGELEVEKIEKVKGEYSWGGETEKIFYKLGKAAKPQIDEKLKKFLEKKKLI